MSDNWIIFIPTRPDYVPNPPAQQAARDLLAELLPQAEVTASVSPEIEFVHPFGSWCVDGVCCQTACEATYPFEANTAKMVAEVGASPQPRPTATPRTR